MVPAPPPSLPVPSSESAALLSKVKTSKVLSWFGPAFVASIAYIDPGNFATNLMPARDSATSCCGCCCGRT